VRTPRIFEIGGDEDGYAAWTGSHFPSFYRPHTASSSLAMVLARFFSPIAISRPQVGLAVGLLLLALPVASWLRTTRKHDASAARGSRNVHRLPGTLPFFGNTLELLANVPRFHEWLYDICRQFDGEPVLITAWGRPDLVLMCSAEAFEECFKTQFDNFPKGPFQCENLRGILGDGIFAVDHGKWVHQRKTASNLFTARTLREGMASTVRKHTATLCGILQQTSERSDNRVDLFKLFNRLTIEAFSEIAFGIKMDCLKAEHEHPFQTAFDSAQRATILRFVRPTPFWKLQRLLGVGYEGQLQRNMKVIDDTVIDIIAKSLERRQSGGGGVASGEEFKDIVSLFLDNFENSPDSKDRPFDPMYLRDIVVNFLIAGRDTTAQALSWFFLSITQNPRVMTKIRSELRELVPGLFDGSVLTPSAEQVTQLAYLEAAIKETLRLHPSVPFLSKHVQNDIALSDGTFIRKDSNIAVPPWALGRMRRVWGDDATEFKPERFIDATTGRPINYPHTKFVAFNAGPRLCLGKNLAMMEMKIVASSLLSQFDIEVLSADSVTYDFSLTLPVRGELLARVTPVMSVAMRE
jgi:cytochrome P450